MENEGQNGLPENGGGETPQIEPPQLSLDTDVKISNTGQRVAVIIGAIVVVAAAIAVFYMMSAKQKEIERHEKVRAAFQKVHNMGYVDFWTKTQVDLDSLKSNVDFELRLKKMIEESPIRYGKYVTENCLPVLEKALPEYKAITAPNDYADKLNSVGEAAKKLYEVWKSFANELARLEGFFDSKKELDESGNFWLGVQDNPKNEKYTTKAVNYVKLVQCIFSTKGDNIFEKDPEELKNDIEDTCLNDKAKWFRRVAYDCMPALLEKDSQPDDLYKQTLAAFSKRRKLDTSSVFGVKSCLDSTLEANNIELIEEIARAWHEYVTAQNELLGAITESIDQLR